jgi:hypothetical protein
MCNYRDMKDTPKRPPGRPKKYDEPLDRVQVLVFRRQRLDAEAEAGKRGVSISEVYRDWMDKGKKRSK